VDSIAGLLPLVLLGGMLVLLVSRNRAHRRQQLELQASLAPGQEVMTTAGLYGRLSAVEESVVVLEIAPGVHCRYARAAIARVLAGEVAGPTGSGDSASDEAPTSDPPKD
jgi:preprotein translocase subunit YajC